MPRNQIITAGGSFLLLVFVLSHVSLYSSLFDYRFGFVALAAGILGLSTGLAISYCLVSKSAENNAATWIVVAALGIAVSVGAALIVPFGTVASFLWLVVVSGIPIAFWGMGIAALHREQGTTLRESAWAGAVGGIAGVIASAWLPNLAGGPLQASLLVAVALAVVALVATPHRLIVALSVATSIVIGLVGIYSDWDFSRSPRWVQDKDLPSKQLYAEATSGPVQRLSTQWDIFSRTDVVDHQTGNGNLLWTYTNGMFSGMMPVERPGQGDAESLKKNIPLVTLPLQAGQPQSILIINPGAGLEVRMAADQGVSRVHGLESSLALRPVLERWRDYHGGLSARPGVEMAYGDVRNALRRDSGRFDQIYLPVVQNQVPGWTERGPADIYLYTKEAFRDYWSHLEPGGMLIVLAGEEKLYMRSLLMAWETLKENAVDGDDSLVRHAWGFRMTGMESLERPYGYLLMLVKGPVADDLGARVQELARAMPMVGLFGPNIIVSSSFDVRYQPYNMLYHPQGLDLARTALSDAMSWHLQTPADMASATDQRPFFFQIIRDIHPFLKWFLAACVILLIYIFQFPLAAERRLDHPVSGAYPPLPVMLGYFLFLGAGAMLTVVALMEQAVLFLGYPDAVLLAVAVSLLLGAAGGAALYHRYIGGNSRYGTIVLAVLCGVLYWMRDGFPAATADWPALLRMMLIIVLAVPIGFFSVTLLLSGMDRLSRSLAALLPWALLTLGLAVVGSVALAFWFAQQWGWGLVLLVSAGCFFAVMGVSAWLSWSEKHRQLGMTAARMC